MGIKFYKRSVYDFTNSLPTTTVTDAIATDSGEDYAFLMRNRNNTSGWMTTGSTDAANTTIEIDFNDLKEFNRILVLKHNLKAFTITYWDGFFWVAFSTPINETVNTKSSNYFEFDTVETQKIKLTITAAQTVDADKFINQILISEFIGEFKTQVEVQPVVSKDRRTTKYLSGKSFVAKAVGGFSCKLKQKAIVEEIGDFELAEKLFNVYDGFLMSLSGGTDTQYLGNLREGYRLEDVYFMACSNEYTPQFIDSRYASGMPLDLTLVEVN